MSFRFQIIRDFTFGLLKLGFYTHMQSFHVSIHSCIPQIFTECCFGASFQSPGVLAPQVGRGDATRCVIRATPKGPAHALCLPHVNQLLSVPVVAPGVQSCRPPRAWGMSAVVGHHLPDPGPDGGQPALRRQSLPPSPTPPSTSLSSPTAKALPQRPDSSQEGRGQGDV